MKLSDKVKQNIITILDGKEFKTDLYEGLDMEKRKELGQFYTPAKLCIQMLESYKCDSLAGKTILDPTCGSGNLLIACLLAGADSDKLFGNEYDLIAVELCRKRLNRACDLMGQPHIQDWQIHQGNALQRRCLTDFGPEYSSTGITSGSSHYNPDYIDDLEYAQSYAYDKIDNPFSDTLIVAHYGVKSWREENSEAKRRAFGKKSVADKPKPTERKDSEPLSLW